MSPKTYKTDTELHQEGLTTLSDGAVNKINKDPLPAQPLNRFKLLEAIQTQLRTANGKTGMATLMQGQEAFDVMGDILPDKDLQAIIFSYVRDGDERAIVRRFFQNLDD